MLISQSHAYRWMTGIHHVISYHVECSKTEYNGYNLHKWFSLHDIWVTGNWNLLLSSFSIFQYWLYIWLLDSLNIAYMFLFRTWSIFQWLLSFRIWELTSSFFCSRASDYGLMKIDGTGRIVHFAEKPKGPNLAAMVHAFTTYHFFTHISIIFLFLNIFIFLIIKAIYVLLVASVISFNQWSCLFHICPIASWYLHIRAISARCYKISIHCINGRVCV